MKDGIHGTAACVVKTITFICLILAAGFSEKHFGLAIVFLAVWGSAMAAINIMGKKRSRWE